jgi:hypothetical protein
MKLELVHKSIYTHDSLRENTFYDQFRRQLSADLYYKVTNCLHEEVRSVRIRRPILEFLR